MVRLDFCPQRRECLQKDYNYSCENCFAFWCYEFGFAEGAKRAIHTINGVEPILLKQDLPLSLRAYDGKEELNRIITELGGKVVPDSRDQRRYEE